MPVILSAVGVLAKQAATPTTGYTLVNGTGNVITWTAPNDGQQHRFQITGSLNVTSLETGGEIDLAFTTPDGTAVSGVPLFNSGLGAGVSATFFSRLCKANTTVTVSQAVALSGGAAVAYFEIWGS